MIIREILHEPLAMIGRFDFFNDYRDTRQFLRGEALTCAYTAEVLRLLDAANDIWNRQQRTKLKQ